MGIQTETCLLQDLTIFLNHIKGCLKKKKNLMAGLKRLPL